MALGQDLKPLTTNSGEGVNPKGFLILSLDYFSTLKISIVYILGKFDVGKGGCHLIILTQRNGTKNSGFESDVPIRSLFHHPFMKNSILSGHNLKPFPLCLRGGLILNDIIFGHFN